MEQGAGNIEERFAALYDRSGEFVNAVQYTEDKSVEIPDIIWCNRVLYCHFKSDEHRKIECYREAMVNIVMKEEMKPGFELSRLIEDYSGKRQGFSKLILQNLDLPSVTVGMYGSTKGSLVLHIGTADKVRATCAMEDNSLPVMDLLPHPNKNTMTITYPLAEGEESANEGRV